MGKILCATRGGEDSQRTQQAAIALAQERGDELVFLYVADASFLDRIAAAVVVDVQSELDQMGRRDEVGRLLAEHNMIGFGTYGEQFHGMHANQTLTGVAIGQRAR